MSPRFPLEKPPQNIRPSDRRSFVRIPVSADAIVTLLVPDATATKFTVRGTASDISYSGIKIISYQIPKYRFLQLIKGLAHAELQLMFPSIEEPVLLKATVVWADFHDEKDGKTAYCSLGLAFHKFTEQAREQFFGILERVAGESLSLAPSAEKSKPSTSEAPQERQTGPPLSHVRRKGLSEEDLDYLRELAREDDDDARQYLSQEEQVLRKLALNQSITIDDLRSLSRDGRRLFEAVVWGRRKD